MKALLALEDGRTFTCKSFTGPGETWGEVVFNTSMTGYQEVLTDPSYKGQIVTMTYPLIGNYGINQEDIESGQIQVSGFIIKEYQDNPSNFRSTSTLAQYLKDQDIMGIEGLDTRALTRHIRNAGAMKGIISSIDLDPESLVKRVKDVPDITGRDLVKDVTTAVPYYWDQGPVLFPRGSVLDKSIWKHRGEKHSIAAFDFGIKYNILRCLEAENFEIAVVPASTSPDIIKQMEPDGIFLSNGPGDPEPVTYAIETIQQLIGYRPMFGICLGQQILGLALGGKTFKLKFGHRGANQPVKNLATGKIEITSQNHGFSVDKKSLDMDNIDITHINLNDNTLEGLKHKKHPLFSVQYHPEASPGPHDSRYLFNDFKKMITA
ncbi:Carbamoyl-phosphate synthase small chain [Desulfonema limicola]|uniref:Carbamoyl phosphate synthase small chain n=1 Tax=Desulfonema limicola TaxID=45656 RepID=A0A975BD47_9BACT|nr:glutamine-hydrolyzing carbamoyl-phosphate synthase small subunit [Desulfonema limicola]QTA83449.1 Carbamoyl-phosphate synthase small chain [Desulfonema limicola]